MTDQGTAQLQERRVDVGSSLVSNFESAVLVQPAFGPFHDPTVNAQSTAMRSPAFGQHRLCSSSAQFPAMGLGIVSTITLSPLESVPGPANLSGHRRHRIHQRQQLRHVVAISRRQRDGHRDAVAIGENVMFAPIFPSIRRIRAGLRPPKTARTDVLSTTARDQSILSASRSWFSSRRCKRCQTPRCCQSRSRRQQVIPEPQPISSGRYSQGIPVFSTNRMPLRVCRWLIGLRPGYRRRLGLGLGKIGSMSSHRLSSSNCLAMIGPPCPTANLPSSGSFC
jgi:hypothetical protein